MSHSETWQNARAKRAERRAADPKVQARAEAHRRREAQERQKANRQQALRDHGDQALAQHLGEAS